jgi:energy-converting hydrogenase Eha subunit G
MTDTTSPLAGRFAQQVGKGRTLIMVAVAEIVLFVIANATYGNAKNNHGPMRTLSNVVWAVFLVGFVVLVVFAVATLVRFVIRRGRQVHEST